ncbi:RNA polymerase II transcription factor B subunit 1 [Steccherinum ochraceum]|uniref:RNA polymerase II transcription factor B subunit 1 n=1 Tax=Steccherinum ochraceum TaxID=92696 RepID=A0A4R0RRK2_9APHY|nr:RNA polymerase II transcription factor B subunit 1 [Steccherinum ochraceum]
MSRAASVSSDSRGTPSTETVNDFRIRKRVLMSSPELAALHRELVIAGHITEAEFWDGREHLLQAQRAAESQKKGKSGQLVDPRPQTVDGEVKIVITPQLVHDIFEEYPVVAKAYSDNVPNKLNEAEFWKRYFQSKLFNAHRASIRSSATQHVVKDDPIFDKYLEKDDDELEPRSTREERVDIFIDLGATLEDHGDTGNEKDVTMQAGKQRAVLPLIRKFNEHSGRLLNTVLGEPAAKRRRIDAGTANEEHYEQIDLEDLHDVQSSAGVILDMQDRQRYFEGRSADTRQAAEKSDVPAAIREARDNAQGWSSRLNSFRLEKKGGEAALLRMTENVSARLEVKQRKNDIPEAILRQMTTCQTAANEFLRQFWLAIYPPPTEVVTASAANSAQKAAKAAKMIGYLEKTGEKVDAIVRSAQADGVNATKVQVGMKPVVDAVEKALSFWQIRNASRTPAVR